MAKRSIIPISNLDPRWLPVDRSSCWALMDNDCLWKTYRTREAAQRDLERLHRQDVSWDSALSRLVRILKAEQKRFNAEDKALWGREGAPAYAGFTELVQDAASRVCKFWPKQEAA